MAKKDKKATDQLNIALSGIESALSIAVPNTEDEMTRHALEKAKAYCEEARDALITIQFHASQI